MLNQQMLQVNVPSNRGQGHSSREIYDQCYNVERTARSTQPLSYKLDPNQINNCNACLSVFGPRGACPSGGRGVYGYGDSSAVGANITAPAQQVVDTESILKNLNVIKTRCKDGDVNPIDVTKYQLQHPRVCDTFLDPVSSLLSNPPQNYREIFVNRFYSTTTDNQANIFYPFAVNTSLEARDNYKIRVPALTKYDAVLPKPV
jgi:hypothetical protein